MNNSVISTHIDTSTNTNFNQYTPVKPETIKDKCSTAHVDPLSIEIDPDTIAAQFSKIGVYDWNEQKYKKYNLTKEDLVVSPEEAKKTFSPYLNIK